MVSATVPAVFSTGTTASDDATADRRRRPNDVERSISRPDRALCRIRSEKALTSEPVEFQVLAIEENVLAGSDD
jgi:hypothetical protein